MTQPLQPNLKGLPYAPAECVVDQRQISIVKQIIADLGHSFDNDHVVPEFCAQYRNWILTTQHNTVGGLEQFDRADFSLGTSECFDKFYLRNHQRRFRCFRGEYLYHRLAWHNQRMPWAWLDDEPLASNDAVVVSLPFADLGSTHPDYGPALLDRCDELGVPVLIDCAFFGICAMTDFDFAHDAITDICFSLSKTFPVNTLRIGMRLTKSAQTDTLSIYNDTQYVNKLGAAVGLKLLQTQGPDDVFQRWRQQQLEWCTNMQLTPSNSVIFGIDYDHRYDHYNRGMTHSNRLCFSRYYQTAQD